MVLVFEHILEGDMDWPLGPDGAIDASIDPIAVDLITRLLVLDPDLRAGSRHGVSPRRRWWWFWW